MSRALDRAQGSENEAWQEVDGSRCPVASVEDRDGRDEASAAQLGKPPRLELLNLIAKYTKLSCAPASSPLNWRTRMRIPIILAFVALALAGCNANQGVNPSGQANLANVYPNYSPYNPIQYAQTSGFYGGR